MVQIKLSVYGILCDQENRILFQKRANTNYAEGWWSLPGGHVDGDETIDRAIRRELEEELGIEQPDCRFMLTLERKPQASHRYINFFFLISKWKGIPRICENKASELLFCARDNLPSPLLPYISEALDQIDKGAPFYLSNF